MRRKVGKELWGAAVKVAKRLTKVAVILKAESETLRVVKVLEVSLLEEK